MNKNSVSDDEQHLQKGNRSHDVVSQLTKITGAGVNIGNEIGAYVKKQPLAAVGIAAGSGFILGSIFGSRLGRIALTAAAGYVVQDIIEGVLGEGGVRKLLADEVSKLANGSKSPS